ncbi:DUF190 domain-containing protein [Zoogloea sp.]|uniref:DUF190 domain-containing protein n=1 Tax=Zoogloea sp. TaxID=49181 RepID=UPI0025EE702D|nr:DUF190 domain-containing protein [Zoogloea sp.]
MSAYTISEIAMHGFQLTFFTQQDRLHGKQPLAQWLLSLVKSLGIRGGTLSGAQQGIGHDGIAHAVNLFDLGDQPVQVTLVATPEEVDKLLKHLAQENVQLFYVKAAVEFGTTGQASNDD